MTSHARSSRSIAVIAAVLGAILISPGAGFASSRAPSPPRSVPGQALVGVAGNHRSLVGRSITQRGGTILSYYSPGRFFIVRAPDDVTTWLTGIRNAAGVRYAEPDFVVTAADTTPNDPSYPSQWGLPAISAPRAWDTTTGSPDVVVGVIDSGVDYGHEDLNSQMWTNRNEIPGDGVDNDNDGYIDDVYGADCRNNDGDPMDDNRHGTHVAGIIGAATDNGVGTAGVSWHIRIMALKFLSSSASGSLSDAIECIDYAIAHGAMITNNSWGGAPYSQALSDAIARASAAGQLFVAAAGNGGSNTDTTTPFYPADYDLDNVLSVAAAGSTDSLASTSNFGPISVDLAAPGVDVLSTLPGNTYGSLSGTSMAAPQVSGAAALVLSAYPGLGYSGVSDRLLGSVDKVPSLAGLVATGGRLNVAHALEADDTPPSPLGLSVATTDRNTVTLSWTAPGDDGAAGGSVSSYRLRYAPTGTQSWAPAPAPPPALSGTTQSAVVSGLRPGMGYDFLLTAKDDAGNASDATVSATTLAGSEIFFDDMESGSAKWTANAPWAITTETPHSSSRSWSDSPFGIYSNSGDASIVSTSFSLVGTSSPKLSFWTRYGLETNFDFGYVYVSPNGGSTWTELARLTGASAFKPVVLDLAAYTSSSNVRLRFRMKSDSFVGAEGWYMDDVLVSAADTTAPAAPQGLVATAGDRQVFLDWVDNTEPDLDSYRVSRTTDAPESPSRSWQQIASVSASTYTDAALANGTSYYYRVSAVDLDGNESPPSAESSAQPSTRIQTYAASSVTIAKGASLGDAVSNLADSDDRYFRVDSARKGAKWDVDWYGSATIDPAGAKKLTVTYEGSWTASVTQQLYVWDFSTSSWQRFASQTVSTSDIGSTWSTLTPARHISAQGEVRLRVTIQKPTDARVTVRGDQMRFTVEY